MNKNESLRDYSLVGKETPIAIKNGLADAKWYQSPVPKAKMKELLVRKNGPALRDTFLWFALIIGSGILVYLWWGSWLVIFPYVVYSVLYASTSDSRWHESSHGTAFKSDWMNTVLYEISSFMVFRQSNVWRWSHARHHSDTIIRGRDPEIAVKRPPKTIQFIKTFLGVGAAIPEFKRMLFHASGRIDPEVASYVPESEHKAVIRVSRVYLFIFAVVILLSLITQSILPLMYVGLPTFFGTWLMPVYGLTQHAGLQENVLDHRLNCRTVYMNRIHRFLYWNMNYHVEHHMFPLVPYHALPELHKTIKDDCPPPYKSIYDAFKEIIPAVRKQMKDTGYYVERILPEGAGTLESTAKVAEKTIKARLENGKVLVCKSGELQKGETLRFDYNQHTFALYRTNFDNFYATEGICSHGNAHLAEGMVIGEQIECAKHNGRFNLSDGSPGRMPVCEGIKTFKVEQVNGFLALDNEEIADKLDQEQLLRCKVVQNKNVTPFIKELELQPFDKNFSFLPGQYMQLKVPPHQTSFSQFHIQEPHLHIWQNQQLSDGWSTNEHYTTRNYSLANKPSATENLKFNVRLAVSPKPKEISAGAGSSYVFALQAGDEVELAGAFGSFLIKNTEKEMVYIGGGAGMAPIRSHIAHLFETLKTKRKVSFWYGARSESDLFYTNYFEELENRHSNFSFCAALSDPGTASKWQGERGLIHDVAFRQRLKKHSDLLAVEFYLCGPPPMVAAAKNMLLGLGVDSANIASDEF
ncbi:fatty acid desaturase [uncultured Draconibacterium sp.]|uniref:fatty acid desaturase n=1 Tax=uncultured Draconibacterium sp. TaxID=1573823 RepID=UPI0025D30D37|nr:fatty acid desaturase [uncultured Draconibacterium sp.]